MYLYRKSTVFSLIGLAVAGIGAAARGLAREEPLSGDASDLEKKLAKAGSVIKIISLAAGCAAVIAAAAGLICEAAEAVRERRSWRSFRDIEPEPLDYDEDEIWTPVAEDGDSSPDDVEIGPEGMIFNEKAEDGGKAGDKDAAGADPDGE